MKQSKLVQNRKKCIGCHSCVELAPQNWVIDEKDGKSRLIGAREKRGLHIADVFDCDKEANQKVVKACPMKIIKLENS